jgi:hypothetical protein
MAIIAARPLSQRTQPGLWTARAASLPGAGHSSMTGLSSSVEAFTPAGTTTGSQMDFFEVSPAEPVPAFALTRASTALPSIPISAPAPCAAVSYRSAMEPTSGLYPLLTAFWLSFG